MKEKERTYQMYVDDIIWDIIVNHLPLNKLQILNIT